jgi:hypothetical protein
VCKRHNFRNTAGWAVFSFMEVLLGGMNGAV